MNLYIKQALCTLFSSRNFYFPVENLSTGMRARSTPIFSDSGSEAV